MTCRRVLGNRSIKLGEAINQTLCGAPTTRLALGCFSLSHFDVTTFEKGRLHQ